MPPTPEASVTVGESAFDTAWKDDCGIMLLDVVPGVPSGILVESVWFGGMLHVQLWGKLLGGPAVDIPAALNFDGGLYLGRKETDEELVVMPIMVPVVVFARVMSGFKENLPECTVVASD